MKTPGLVVGTNPVSVGQSLQFSMRLVDHANPVQRDHIEATNEGPDRAVVVAAGRIAPAFALERISHCFVHPPTIVGCKAAGVGANRERLRGPVVVKMPHDGPTALRVGDVEEHRQDIAQRVTFIYEAAPLHMREVVATVGLGRILERGR